MKKSVLKKIEIKIKWFLRSLELSRANSAKLAETNKSVILRNIAGKIMQEGVVDKRMDYI